MIAIKFLAIIALCLTVDASRPPTKRSYGFKIQNNQHDFDSYDFSQLDGTTIPFPQNEYFSTEIDKFLPPMSFNVESIPLKVSFPPHKGRFPIPTVISNSIEKPVQEVQEYVPPQFVGSAVIPQMIPAATPVNAAAANVPAPSGALFLGGGSLGLVNLGNGAYALGAGSLGYSTMRSQPRPSAMVPAYPPLQATPDLVPAAVPSQPAPQINVPQIPRNVDFNHPLFNVPFQQLRLDSNGYESIRPNQVRFGMAVQRPPRLRTTLSFATPTAPDSPPPLFGDAGTGPIRFMQEQQPPQQPQRTNRPPSLYALNSGL